MLSAQALGGGDVKAANTWTDPHAVEPFDLPTTLLDGALRLTLPAPGMAVVRVELGDR